MLFASALRPSGVSHLSTCPTMPSDSPLSLRGDQRGTMRPHGGSCAFWGKWMLASTVLLLVGLGGIVPNAAAQTAHFSGAQTVLATNLYNPNGVAVDAIGNLYIADSGNNQVLKVPFLYGGYGSATPVVSGLNFPVGLAVDASGNNLYICEASSKRVLKETLSGGIFTLSAIVLDGNTSVSGLTVNSPRGIAVDDSGNLYISDMANNRVLQVMWSGTTYYPPTVVDPMSDINFPEAVAVDIMRNVYINEGGSRWVKESHLDYNYFESAHNLPSIPSAIAVDVSRNVYVGGNGGFLWMEPWISGNIYGAPISIGTGLSWVKALAVDGSGNLFIADTELQKVLKLSLLSGANFGMVNAGSTSSTPATLIFTFDTTGIIGTPQVLTQGAPNLDFVDAGTGTCTINASASHSYSVGEQCTVDVNFTPKFTGTRFGAVVLKDSLGNVIATGYVEGMGAGPQINFSPVGRSTIPTGSASKTQGVAVDGSGNLYVSYIGSSSVDKIVAVGGSIPDNPTVVSVGGGFSAPYGLAVDGAGNVFVADEGSSNVQEIPQGCLTSACVVTLGGGFNNPYGLAVDGNGNVFVADTSSSEIKEIPVGCFNVTCVLGPLGNSFDHPLSVAVDASGNVFVTDFSDQIKEIVAFHGVVSGASPVQRVGSGFNGSRSVAVDGRGNVFVSEQGPAGARGVKEIIATGGVILNTSKVVTVGSDFQFPVGIVVDGSGNVYIADAFTTGITKLDLADAPALSFPTVDFGSTSSAQTVILTNTGNTDLKFSIPAAQYRNPTIGADFSLETAGMENACMVQSHETGPMALPAGDSCRFYVHFTPVVVGPAHESLTMTTDNLNHVNDTQTMALTGTANAGTATVALSNLSQTYNGSPEAATVSTEPGGLTVAITYDDGTTTVASAIAPTNAGYYTVKATVQDLNYIGTQTGTLVIAQATPVITWTEPDPIPYGTALSNTQLNALPSVAGQMDYSPLGESVLDAGKQTLSVTFTPTDAANYTSATGTVSLTVNPATPVLAFSVLDHAYGDAPFTVSASSKSTGAFTYTVVSGMATISGSTVTLIGARTVVLLASQAADLNYTASTKSATFTVGEGTPSIYFVVDDHTWGDRPFNVGAGSSSTGAFTYTVVSGPATISDSILTLTGVGTVRLLASEGADSNNVAGTKSATFTVAAGTPSLLFTVPDHAYGDAPFTVSASSKSTGAFTYTVVSGPATISDSTVTLTGEGTVTLGVDQVANGNYAVGTATTTFVVTVGMTLTSGTGTGSGSGTGSGTVTVAPGAPAAIPLLFTPGGGGTYPNALTLSVVGLPLGATSTFSPASIPAGSPATAITLTISSIKGIARNENPFSGGPWAPLALGFLLLPLVGMKSVRRQLRQMPRLPLMLAVMILSLGATVGLSSCGGHSRAATNYNLVITATDTITGAHSSTNQTLTVK